MEYSLDLVKVFCDLHNSQSRNLFALIENVTDRMLDIDGEQFFTDVLSQKININYEPTNRAETNLPLEVFDYFMNAPESTTAAFYRYVPHPTMDEDGNTEDSQPELYFSHDIGELLLVLTGQIQL